MSRQMPVCGLHLHRKMFSVALLGCNPHRTWEIDVEMPKDQKKKSAFVFGGYFHVFKLLQRLHHSRTLEKLLTFGTSLFIWTAFCFQ